MRPRRFEPQPEKEHGPHTLRVWRGTVVGVNGRDVFVELGPRMQGVIARDELPEGVTAGDTFDFTLRGQEEELWVLALAESKSLSTWEDMECGSLVEARVIRPKPGGLELKVGPLHAFMPKSQTGLQRGQKPDVLAGKTITCEVIEVDAERQRVILSRKLVEQRARESRRYRELGNLKPGQVVQGRVTRVEPYGAFVAFGRGLEGLVHVSNLALERVDDPSEIVKVGEHVEAKVLNIRQGGKRIGLGIKQMQESPWKDVERFHYFDQIVEGVVTRLAEYGVFVRVRTGVEGLLHNSESGLHDKRAREVLAVGQRLSVRIQDFDCEAERMSLSLLHRGGGRIAPDEAANSESLAELADADGTGPLATNLGRLLKKALDADPRRTG